MVPGFGSSQLAVLVLGAIAAWCDIRTRHIPNLLTFGVAVAAIAYGLMTQGLGGGVSSVGGWLVGCALFLPFFVLGGMGAGDVKLLAAIGGWLGPRDAFMTGLYAAIAGGVMALALALATGYLGQALRNTTMLLSHWRVFGLSRLPALTLAEAHGHRLPYAFPIAAGTLAAIWLRR